MNILKSLTKEMVRYMLAIFGLNEYSVYNTIGIINDDFKTNKVIKIEYDDGEVKELNKFPIFSASASFNDSKFHAVGSRLEDHNNSCYVVLFKLDNFFTYGIKYDSTTEDFIFLVSKNAGSWSNLNMYEKIIACAGLEKLNDSGIIWKKEDIGDFYNTLLELVDM